MENTSETPVKNNTTQAEMLKDKSEVETKINELIRAFNVKHGYNEGHTICIGTEYNLDNRLHELDLRSVGHFAD